MVALTVWAIMSLSIRWQDVSGIQRMGNMLGVLNGHQKHLSLQRAVNHTGDKARTQVIRALAKQTGLNYGVIKKAVRTGRAWGASENASQFVDGRGSLEYVLSSKGGDISLKYFKARETRQGVTAAPFGKRKLFAGAFMSSGRRPNRKMAGKLNGHVYEPVNSQATGKSSWKRRIRFLDSGVVIPGEMLKGASRDAFMRVVDAELAKRVMHEMNRLTGGIFS